MNADECLSFTKPSADTLADMPRSRFTMPVAAVLATFMLALAGCAEVPEPGQRPSKEENFQEPVEQPKFFADGTAADNLPYFHESLRLFGLGESPVQGAPVVDHLVAAGFDKAAMQVSFDESKTELVADNIFVSVLLGSDCLIGQVIVADRSFVTEVVPAVGPEKNVCLIGTTRPIDW